MGTHQADEVAAGRRDKALHLVGLFVFVLLLLVWLGVVFYAPNALNRDWVAFDRAATRAAHGQFRAAYTASANERWPFLYPPFVLYVVSPLAALTYRASYLAVMIGGLGATFGALAFLRASARASVGRKDAFVGLILGCGIVFLAIVPGQLTPLLLLAVVAGAYWHRRGRTGLSGAAFGALIIKPPIAAPYLLYLAVRRDWRALQRSVAVGVIAVLSTAPMGFGVWREFLGAHGTLDLASSETTRIVPIRKQICLLATLRNLFGQSNGWVLLLWLALALVLFGLVTNAVWHNRDSVVSLRVVGLITLMVLVLSPRVYFYELLLVAVPLAGWWFESASYGSRAIRRAAGWTAAGAILTADSVLGPGSIAWIAGGFLTLWLVSEAWDLARGAPSAGAGVDDPGMHTPQPSVIIG